MSEALSNLEIEPEWCSAAVLSSISATGEPNEMPAAEPIILQSARPTPEPLAASAADPGAAPKSEPLPVKSARSVPKIRSESRTTRSKKTPQPKKAANWIAALRSRRVRIVMAVVSVLFACGVVALNWKRTPSRLGDETTELDLSEFNSTSGFDEPRIGNTSEPQRLGAISDAESISETDRLSRTESEPRLPPLGLVTHADHSASRGRPVGGFVPASATSSGSRGAVLTGQIEIESASRSPEIQSRSSRDFGLR